MNCALNGFYAPAQRQRFLDAISKRHSVRKFSSGPDVAQKSALNYAAARVCLPGVRIVMCEGEGEKVFRRLPVVGGVVGTDRYAVLIVDEEQPSGMLHAGISGEAFVLEAVSLGLGACWLGSFKRDGVQVELNDHEKIAAIIAFGVPGETSEGRKRKKLTDICYGDPSRWPLWAYNAAECVRCAPSALNMQPWRMSFVGRTMMLCRTWNGSDLDLGIALLHMSLGAGETEHSIRLGQGKEVATMVAEERL